MFTIKNFEPREYQKNIVKSSAEKTTLICLPTGTGKTKTAILLAVERLNQFPDSKIIMVSPTKPLSKQIFEEFKECTDVPPATIHMLTGMLKAEERKKLFSVAKIIIATPQTIANDVETGIISLEDCSLLVIDECHRSKQKFANTKIVLSYIVQGKNQRIMALTASPGATREKIEEVCKNLYIENVEIRKEEDEDIAPYIQKKEINYVIVELPQEMLKIKEIIKRKYLSIVGMLKKFGLGKPASVVNKRDLLGLQIRLRGEIGRQNRAAYTGISLVAQAIKVEHALGLLETQTIKSAWRFLKDLESEETKAAKAISGNREIKEVMETLEKLEAETEHPKMKKLKEIVHKDLENEKAKIMVFANYRSTVEEIVNALNTGKAKPVKLIGQKDGITQKIQLETAKKFEEGIYNVLVTTSIGEEGLDISGATHAIFYDAVPSEIRVIQRAGRVGRMQEGKITMLMTKNSRDQAYFWTAKKKTGVMQKTLYDLQKKGMGDSQSVLAGK